MNAEEPQVVPCGLERAEEVHRITQAAFRPHASLDPPSGALRESVEHVCADLAAGGGAMALAGGRPAGCLRWRVEEAGDFYVYRVAVDPRLQRRGIGSAMMAWAEREAARRGCGAVLVGVRIALPDNLAFYQKLGYEVMGELTHDGYARPTGLALRKRIDHGEAQPSRT